MPTKTQHLIETAGGPRFLPGAAVAIICSADRTGRVTADYRALGKLQDAGLVCEDWLTGSGMAVYRAENTTAIRNDEADARELYALAT